MKYFYVMAFILLNLAAGIAAAKAYSYQNPKNIGNAVCSFLNALAMLGIFLVEINKKD